MSKAISLRGRSRNVSLTVAIVPMIWRMSVDRRDPRIDALMAGYGGSMRTASIVSLAAPVVVGLVLSGCAVPLGPTVQVLPGQGKDFAAFQLDQHDCSIYTNDQVRPMKETVDNQQLGSAVLGTVLGAGLGAAIGGGRGAGIGAASGAIAGTAVGTGRADQATNRLQVTYDNTYAACMAARGNVIQQPAVLVQQAPILVQPAPVLVQPAPYAGQPGGYSAAAGAPPPWAQ
jgi:outer membrane lipoprotein SlyB